MMMMMMNYADRSTTYLLDKMPFPVVEALFKTFTLDNLDKLLIYIEENVHVKLKNRQ